MRRLIVSEELAASTFRVDEQTAWERTVSDIKRRGQELRIRPNQFFFHFHLSLPISTLKMEAPGSSEIW
jgi:hypothetical protein